MADHTDLVAAVKADLVARGVSLAGPCGAFEIWRRVVWQLRADGWGFVVAPPGGENCQGFRADKAVTKAGRFVDGIGDAGGANTPVWQERDATPGEIAAWHEPIDPGDVAPPAPSPTPAPSPEAGVDLSGLARELMSHVDAVVAAAASLGAAVDRLTAKLDDVVARGLRVRF